MIGNISSGFVQQFCDWVLLNDEWDKINTFKVN